MLFVGVLFQVKDVSFSLQFDESFYPEWIMDFAKCFFSIEMITYLFVFLFLFQSLDIVNYIDWF